MNNMNNMNQMNQSQQQPSNDLFGASTSNNMGNNMAANTNAGGDILGGFGGMNLNANPPQQQQQQQPPQQAQSTGPMLTAAAPQPQKQNKAPPKKDDAWSMASGLIDLDKGFGKQSLTENKKPPQQQSSNLPNLS